MRTMVGRVGGEATGEEHWIPNDEGSSQKSIEAGG